MSAGHPYTAEPAPPYKQQSNTAMILALVIGALLLMMLLCGGVLVALLLPAVSAAREAAQRMQSSNNLKQIGLALHNYHDTYGSLPPAYTTDANGEPLLSWRVLILPYLEQDPLYRQFHLDEPWDSPHNIQLLEAIPPTYRSPRFDETNTPHETDYVAIRSPESLFPGADPVNFRQITDGTSNTAAVIEIDASGMPWTSPEDATPQQAYAAYASETGSNLLMADASVHQIESETDRETFDALVTRDGQEDIPW